MNSPASISTISQLDHLVIMAATLEEGVQWCEATLGVTPAAGGRHAFMGTHNRLLRTSSDAFAASYLEIIAIDPEGAPPVAPFDKRWFDMDTASLRASVTQHGPQLIHWVARIPDIAASTQALHALDLPAGAPQAASRQTPRGLLEWQIGLRSDGQRLLDGCLPTLIHWGAIHPEASLQDQGVQLLGLELQHPQADALRAALLALNLPVDAPIQVQSGARPALAAHLQTPKGPVTLRSHASATPQ